MKDITIDNIKKWITKQPNKKELLPDTTKTRELYLVRSQLNLVRSQLQKDIRGIDILDARMINAKSRADGR